MTYTEYKKRTPVEITSPKIANKSALRSTKTAPPTNMQLLEKALDNYSKTGSISTDENSNPNSNLKQKSTELTQELSSLETYFKSSSDKHNHPKQLKNLNSQTVADPLNTNPQNALTFHMLELKDESIPNSNITTKTCSSPTSKESIKRKFSCIHTPSNSNIVETIAPPENGSILSASNLITALNTLDDISTVMMSMGTAAIFTPIPGDEIFLLGLGTCLKGSVKGAKALNKALKATNFELGAINLGSAKRSNTALKALKKSQKASKRKKTAAPNKTIIEETPRYRKDGTLIKKTGARIEYNTKKEAFEAAKRAGKNLKPIHHAHGEHGPHFHAAKLTDNGKRVPLNHDHYYY